MRQVDARDEWMKCVRPLSRTLMLVVASLPASLHAREPTLPGVVVVGERRLGGTPGSVDRVHVHDVHGRTGRSVSEELHRLPGVAARDRQNLAQDLQFSIRCAGARSAFGVRGVQLVVDGIPATMPDGQGQLSHVPQAALAHVDVLRGPFSALYGNASGGVVEFTSQDPPLQPAFGFQAGGGSDAGARAALWWGAPWNAGSAGGYRLDADHYDTGGYREHGRARRDIGQARLLATTTGGTQFALTANALDLEAQDPQGLTAAQADATPRAASVGALLFDTRKSVRQQQLGLRVDHPLGDANALVATAWTGARSTFQMLSVPVAAQATPGSGGGVVDLDRSFAGADLRWRQRLHAGARPFDLTLGVEAQRSREHRRGYENFADGQLGVVGALRRDEVDTVDNIDLFAEGRWQFAPRWSTTIGLRRSKVAFRTDDAYIAPGNPDDSGGIRYGKTTPVAGLLFAPGDGVELYANAGEGFETPSFTELAYRSDGGSGLNTALRAAHGRSAEVGARVHRDAQALGFAVFATRTDDELVVTSNVGGRSTYANAARTARDGWELSASGPIADHWRYALALTRLDARFRAGFATCRAPPCAQPDTFVASGNRLPATSDSAWAELRWTPRDRLEVFLQADASGRMAADDANTAWAGGWTTFDVGVERRWHVHGRVVTASLRVDNLLDRRTLGSVIVNDANGRYFEPAPGRGGWIGLAFEPATP